MPNTRPRTSRDELMMIQSVQEDQNLVRQPAENKHSKNQVCSLLLAVPKVSSNVVATERNNGNRDKEAYYVDVWMGIQTLNQIPHAQKVCLSLSWVRGLMRARYLSTFTSVRNSTLQ